MRLAKYILSLFVIAIGVLLVTLLSLATVRAAPPPDYEMEKAKAAVAVALAKAKLVEDGKPSTTTKCFNCTRECCGDNCKCFGGQYYCKDGVCPIDISKPAPQGYQWQRRQGEDWKLVKLEVVPAVTTPQPFRGLQYNGSHTCPSCGYTSPAGTGTWVIQGYTTGGHIHACPRCGTRWYH